MFQHCFFWFTLTESLLAEWSSVLLITAAGSAGGGHDVKAECGVGLKVRQRASRRRARFHSPVCAVCLSPSRPTYPLSTATRMPAGKIGINGFGRIGRLVLRAAIQKGATVGRSMTR